MNIGMMFLLLAFDSSVGRAQDCNGISFVILMSLVRSRLEGSLLLFSVLVQSFGIQFLLIFFFHCGICNDMHLRWKVCCIRVRSCPSISCVH
jgi:hypothetical protein